MPSKMMSLARFFLYLLVFAAPIFFLPTGLESLESGKQTLTVTLVLFALLSYLSSLIFRGRMSIKRGWLNLLPLAFLASILVSTIFSGGFRAWIGGAGQEYTSFLSLAAFVLLFYLTTNLFITPGSRRMVILLSLLSALIASIVGILSLLKIYLPFDFAQSQTFNTVGTLNGLSAYLIAMMVLGHGVLAVSRKKIETVVILLLTVGTLFLLLVLDYWLLWVLLLVGEGVLLALALWRAKNSTPTSRFILPITVFAVALLFLPIKVPVPVSAPEEVGLGFGTSFDIAMRTLSETSWFFGSGPGSFAFDYMKYQSPDVNDTALWNIRFDYGASYFITMLATMGLLGAGLWLVFAGSLAAKSLAKPPALDLFPAWLCLFIAAFLFPFSFTLNLLFFVLSGLLFRQAPGGVIERRLENSPRSNLAFSLLFVVLLISTATAVLAGFERYRAGTAFAQAIKLDRQEEAMSEVTMKLEESIKANPWNDLYYRHLSQALLRRLTEELSRVSELGLTRPNQAEQDKELQGLVGSSINAAVKASELAPEDAVNWLNRGLIYRELMPYVDGAGRLAVESFAKAVELEPMNPADLTELGRAHLIVAENFRLLAAAEDEALALASAEAVLNQAIELKKDFSPAHFQLAIVYSAQGRLDEAIGKMESVERYNPFDVGVAFQLGLLYLRRGAVGDLDRAIISLEKTVRLAPAFANALWYLSSIYEQKGDLTKALEFGEKVLGLNPDDESAQARVERLRVYVDG